MSGPTNGRQGTNCPRSTKDISFSRLGCGCCRVDVRDRGCNHDGVLRLFIDLANPYSTRCGSGYCSFSPQPAEWSIEFDESSYSVPGCANSRLENIAFANPRSPQQRSYLV